MFLSQKQPGMMNGYELQSRTAETFALSIPAQSFERSWDVSLVQWKLQQFRGYHGLENKAIIQPNMKKKPQTTKETKEPDQTKPNNPPTPKDTQPTLTQTPLFATFVHLKNENPKSMSYLCALQEYKKLQ